MNVTFLFAGLFACSLAAAPRGMAGEPQPDTPTPPAERAVAPPITFEKDLVYGRAAGVDLKLDLARPAAGKGPFPAVVWFHGGGWQAGSKSDNGAAIRELAAHGYIAASVEYRFAPRFPFPAQVEDAKCAVRYLRSRARELSLDTAHIGACGESAGGYLALMVGLTEPKDSMEGAGGHPDQSSRVQAVVSYVSVTDFSKSRKPPAEAEEAVRGYYGGKTVTQVVAEFMGSPTPDGALLRRLSPVSYVDAGDPPVFTFYGDHDPFVHAEQGDILHQALTTAGVETHTYVVKGGGHGWTGADKATTDRLALAFFERHLKPASPTR